MSDDFHIVMVSFLAIDLFFISQNLNGAENVIQEIKKCGLRIKTFSAARHFKWLAYRLTFKLISPSTYHNAYLKIFKIT